MLKNKITFKHIENIICMIFILFTAIYMYANIKKNEEILKEKKNLTEIDNKINNYISYKDSISNLIFELNIKYPNIVLAQSILESGNFTSDIFKENNNPFGMKIPLNRVTTAKGIKNGHAYYSSLREAVIDYAFLQAYYYKEAKSEEDYYRILAKSYAKDSKYIEKIKQIANSLK